VGIARYRIAQPSRFSQQPGALDLMARLRLTDAVALQANIRNLNNAYDYDGIDNNHVVPLAGRSVLFTLTTQF
jgi:outer membrane receptor for ferric coprogen and ferric-rhodotorulic acid